MKHILLFENYNNKNLSDILDFYNNPDFVKTLEYAIEKIEHSSFICTYVASAIKMLEGNKIKVYGFSQAENPTAIYFKQFENDEDEGHHFAVMYDRYIIDPWIFNNFKINSNEIYGRSVYDLQDVKDIHVITEIYGDKNCWSDITEKIYSFDTIFPKATEILANYKNENL